MILDPAITIARKGALAYVGAIALTGDILSAAVDQLATRGEAAARTTRTRLRATAGEVEETMREGVAEATEQAEQTSSMLSQSRDRLLGALNIPTHASILKLDAEVAELSAQIDELRGALRRGKAQAKAAAAAPAEPLPGYSKMNVETVLGWLAAQTEPTLLAIRAYEQTHSNRITVLRAVERALIERQAARGALAEPATHTSVEPLPGYADLHVDEVVERLPALSEAELLHLKTYEQEHQARVTVLRALDERLAPQAEA